MSTAEFCDASAGRYLVNDSCTFGVELFVKKNMATKAVCLSNVSMPKNDFCMMRAHIWKFDNFSKRKNKLYYSNSFMAGKRKWYISTILFYIYNYAQANRPINASIFFNIFLPYHSPRPIEHINVISLYILCVQETANLSQRG